MQSKTNVLSGENVTYTYDALNRLATSQTTQTPTTAAPQWGDGYSFDGFGNLTDVTPIGTGLTMHTTFAAATNRETGTSYDANGNQLNSGAAYDVDNRAITGGGKTYGYAPHHFLARTTHLAVRLKRILKSDYWTGDISTPIGTHLFFHGLGGERLGEYAFNFSTNGQTFSIDLVSTNIWFGGKLLREGDRLTGLDYADQRYFSSTSGRFMTADPYQASGVEEVGKDLGTFSQLPLAGQWKCAVEHIVRGGNESRDRAELLGEVIDDTTYF